VRARLELTPLRRVLDVQQRCTSGIAVERLVHTLPVPVMASTSAFASPQVDEDIARVDAAAL